MADSPQSEVDRPPPSIDPTTLTTQALTREIENLKALMDDRFTRNEVSLSRRLEEVEREIATRFEYIKEIREGKFEAQDQKFDTWDERLEKLGLQSDERFKSIAIQFLERDTRQERESKDNKVAVDAAFAAQKEAASEQNKSNTLAISKSEVATQETINKLSELFRTTTDALGDKLDDLKERVGRIEAIKQGGVESRSGLQTGVGLIAAVLGILVTGIVIVGFIASRGP